MIGKVRKNGYYKDCQPMIIILIRGQSEIIPYKHKERVNIDIIVGDRKFIAGVRYQDWTDDIKICQDLVDKEGNEFRLVDILKIYGITYNYSIRLKTEGNRLAILGKV
ncbi:hypothetical protein [Desulfuromonas sp.]|uniref:hypothetical protein n=1 Tax=Desulfuromonas sp. TaxID=892 RepID=UPI0025C5C3AE|nr:hypothetical protein [Desulfuromonas sp.]